MEIKAKIVSDIQSILGRTLVEAPKHPDVVTGLVIVKEEQAKFAVEGNVLIGLNLFGCKMTDQQWDKIVRSDWFHKDKIRALNLGANDLEAIGFSKEYEQLEQLHISDCEKLRKVSFEEGLPSLVRMHIRDNENLKRIELSGNFDKLKYLELSRNGLSGFDVKGVLPELMWMDLNGNRLKNFDVEMLTFLPNIEYLYLGDNPLNQSLKVYQANQGSKDYLNSLQNLKKQFDKGEKIKNEAYKVIIVGDGTAGKTCLVNRLIFDKFIEDDSTHGISVQKFTNQNDVFDSFPYVLNLWDFGGQDIYHSTHRLFLQSDAIYLLVWKKETEVQDMSEARINKSGRTKAYKNRKLEYWMQYVYSYGKGSPVLIVRTCKEENPDFRCADRNNIREKYEDKLSYIDFLEIDSKPNDAKKNGYKRLVNRLREAIEELGREEYLPSQWVEVKNFLESQTPKSNYESKDQFLNAEDATFDYQLYCEKAKDLGVNDPKELLTRWLVPIGTVFYKEEYFENKIILNQEWAIRAIYILFERSDNGFYEEIRDNEGSFTGKELLTYWNNYGINERKLFIDYMLVCGMCYEVEKESDDNREMTFEDRLFVAPEMMPEKRPGAFAIQEKDWKEKSENVLHVRYDYDFPYYNFFQQFLVKTQADAEEMTDAYRYGMLIYDKKAYAIIEFSEGEKCIKVSVSEHGKDLLDRIRNRFKEIHTEEFKTWFGIGDSPMISLSKINELNKQSLNANDKIEAEGGQMVAAAKYIPFLKLNDQETFTKADKMKTINSQASENLTEQAKIYFSYAWADDKKDEGEREQIVSALYTSLKEGGFNIIRDKEYMNYMDSIKDFMKDLSKGDQIFIFISNNYFKSINCMKELDMIVKESKTDEEEFRKKVVLVPIEWVPFNDSEVVTNYVEFWYEEKKKLENQAEKLKKMGSRSSTKDLEKLKLLQDLILTLPDTVSWMTSINQSNIKALANQDFEQVKQLLSGRLAFTNNGINQAKIEDTLTAFSKRLQNIENKIDEI